MKELLQREFGFEIMEIKKLSGYDNVNFLLKTDAADYIFKTYAYDEELLADLAAWAIIFGATRRRASCRIWSSWASRWATATRWAQS